MRSRPIVQAQDVSYELHTLGWKAFQDLCATVTAEILGQTIETFLPSKDAGRDGAFCGAWHDKTDKSVRGSFTVQCKFVSNPKKTLSVKDLKDEVIKAARLASQGLSDNYLLMTNAGVSGIANEKIVKSFTSIAGLSECRVFGRERISQFIRESARLRMLVPRIYGLGDLGQIFDQRAYDQAQEILSSLGDDFAKFVITAAHRQSAKALLDTGFVFLLGGPAVGKSTIAAALTMGALDLWECWPIKISSAAEFREHWNPHERQFFWVDDVFGATQYERSRVMEWNHMLGHLSAAVRKNTRVLFTSRGYIYQSALSDLKIASFPRLRESQVIIHVEELTNHEREQILYSHIKRGTQKTEFKRDFKKYFNKVANNTHFTPEIARRLGDPFFTSRLTLSDESLRKFVEEPLDFLLDVFRTLDPASKAALALIFMRAGKTPSPLELTSEEVKALDLLGADFASVRKALLALDSSLVLRVREGGRMWWKFKHPTVRDAVSIEVASDPELLGIYLAGAPIEKLLSEISCGDFEGRNVKVIVPPERYDVVLRRLPEWDEKSYTGHFERQALIMFLNYRCDTEFLRRYIDINPTVFEKLGKFGPYMNAYTAPSLFVRLHNEGLLQASTRVLFIERVKNILRGCY